MIKDLVNKGDLAENGSNTALQQEVNRYLWNNKMIRYNIWKMAIWTRWISPFRPITSCWHCTFLQSMEMSSVKPLDFFWGGDVNCTCGKHTLWDQPVGVDFAKCSEHEDDFHVSSLKERWENSKSAMTDSFTFMISRRIPVCINLCRADEDNEQRHSYTHTHLHNQ